MRPVDAIAVLFACASLGALAAEPGEAARRVVEGTNAFRKAQGLQALDRSRQLDETAHEFARFMARSGQYGHTADGRRPPERASARGYDYCIVSENLAYLHRSRGYDAATLAGEMVEGWKGSPEHRKNLVDPAVTQTGVGIAIDEQGRYFGVQMLGRPKSAAIRFTVRNSAGRTIGYRAGERSYSLRARAARTHTVCRPLALTIDVPAPFTAHPDDGASYTVVERAGGVAVTRP